MSAPGGDRAESRRLVEVDALRGVAAMAVVLFHYTTRYVDLYGGSGRPTFSFSTGHYGVNLFFIISGFVIFMTLGRTRRPADFVVSRFSRLFPAYWVAVLLTFATTALFGLSGKEVSPLQALANLAMVHGFFKVPHVDGVYWTLEIELLFYAWMLLLFSLRSLQRVHLFLWALLALRLVYHVAAMMGREWSWTLSHLLILKYIPWFALGVAVHQLVSGDAPRRGLPKATVLLALACLGAVDGVGMALLATVLAGLVWAAASGRLPWLAHPVLAFFGTISYTLYLLHENIGWVTMRELQARGVSFDVSIVVAIGLSVALASLVTFLIERPAMAAIRTWYRQRPGLAVAR